MKCGPSLQGFFPLQVNANQGCVKIAYIPCNVNYFFFPSPSNKQERKIENKVYIREESPNSYSNAPIPSYHRENKVLSKICYFCNVMTRREVRVV